MVAFVPGISPGSEFVSYFQASHPGREAGQEDKKKQ